MNIEIDEQTKRRMAEESLVARGGLPRRPAIPPVELLPVELAGPARRYGDFIRAWFDQGAVIERCRQDVRGAPQRDAEAYKAALQAGGDDPGQIHEQEATQALDAAVRKRQALDLAARAEMEALGAALGAVRDSWTAELADLFATAQRGLAKSLDATARAAAEVQQLANLQGWVSSFPDDWRPTAGTFGNVQNAHGDPMSWPAILDAMRAMTEGPD